MRDFDKKLVLLIAVAVLLVVVFEALQISNLRGSDPSIPHSAAAIPYSDFIRQVDAGEVSEVFIQGDLITGHTADNWSFVTLAPPAADMVDRLTHAGVRVTSQEAPSLFGILLGWLPMLLLVICLWVLIVRMLIIYIRHITR